MAKKGSTAAAENVIRFPVEFGGVSIGDVAAAIGVKIEGTFDIKRLGIDPEHYTARLTFSRSEIQVGTLADFSKKKGRIVISDSEELPDGEDADDAGDGDD